MIALTFARSSAGEALKAQTGLAALFVSFGLLPEGNEENTSVTSLKAEKGDDADY